MSERPNDGRGSRPRGRTPGITPKFIRPEAVVHIPASQVQVGYLLHDGMVLDIDIEYSPATGKPVEYVFDLPHTLLVQKPEDMLTVYGRVPEAMAKQCREAYKRVSV